MSKKMSVMTGYVSGKRYVFAKRSVNTGAEALAMARKALNSTSTREVIISTSNGK